MENKESSSKESSGNSPSKSTDASSAGATASASTSRSVNWRDVATQVAPSTTGATCSTGNADSTGNYRKTAEQIMDILSSMEARVPALIKKTSNQEQRKEEEDVKPVPMPESRPSLKVDSDFEFEYKDTDTHQHEIGEWYCHSERPEFQLNYEAFESQMKEFKMPKTWREQNVDQRKSVVMRLLDQLEVTNKQLRMSGARCILYIAQGCWKEVKTEAEQEHYETINVMLLYELAVFDAFIALLDMEIDSSSDLEDRSGSLEDSKDLRVILSVLYTITEVMLQQRNSDSSNQHHVLSFETDLANPLGGELLVVKLFKMIEKFSNGEAPTYPIKKILLLLWKLILISLGGMLTLKYLKIEKRLEAGLPILLEDTIEIAGRLKSSAPPEERSRFSIMRTCTPKKSRKTRKGDTKPSGQNSKKKSSKDNCDVVKMKIEPSSSASDPNERPSRHHSFPVRSSKGSYKTFPWKTKARQSDVDSFLEVTRRKYLSYTLPGDRDSLIGVPLHIQQSLEILKKSVYTSLGEVQIEKEKKISRGPMTRDFQEEIEMTPTELLYQALWPNLSKYIQAVLDLFTAASPLSWTHGFPFNILADVLPRPMPTREMEKINLKTDCNTHQEVIMKATSAILLLLLKHFKLNHIYQFEFLSDQLVSMGCIPLIIRFFEHSQTVHFVRPKNTMQLLDFPSFLIEGRELEFLAERLRIIGSAVLSSAVLCWRNMFTYINVLRILNKVTKCKSPRILTMVKLKSSVVLTRTLSIRHPITQLYALKLIKMQTRYLGRGWRRKNMDTISAIYQTVRHRFNDDWTSGNDIRAKASYSEENALRDSVSLFNKRRYKQEDDEDQLFLDM